jgi:hypothetical protein
MTIIFSVLLYIYKFNDALFFQSMFNFCFFQLDHSNSELCTVYSVGDLQPIGEDLAC